MDPYNPLDKKNLGISVADALLTRERTVLPPSAFEGAGVYALYYAGDFPAYERISLKRRQRDEIPIYVGKAVPAGARKGGFGLGEDPGDALFKRLREHAGSIVAASNLAIDDFTCRHLVVDDIWIPLGEALLIEMFRPVWNTVVDGFGNHPPGSGRKGQQKSLWDVLHPGRAWADELPKPARRAAEISMMVFEHLEQHHVPRKVFDQK